MMDGGALPPPSTSTLDGVLAFHAERAPGSVALSFEGRETTYGELRRWADGLASRLQAEGLSPGDRVAYLGKNSDAYFVLLYAAAFAGLVLAPLNWRLVETEWTFIVEDCGARRLFTDASFLEAGQPLARRSGLTRAEALEDVLDRGAGASAAPTRTAAPDDELLQIYTSGTTGRPKGAMLSHRNLLALRAPGYAAGLHWFPQAKDVCLLVLPVAHVAGTAYALFTLYGGGRVVIARDFDPPAVLASIARDRVSHILLAPAAMRLLLEEPGVAVADLSSLRYMTYGASPIPQALLDRALAAIGCGFVQMYGMTEAAGGVVALSPEDHLSGDADRLRSAGRAMPGVEIGVVDREGRRLGPGGTGEIVVRSQAVMSGYWNRPQDTDRAFVDGWLLTGDIGRLDAQGYLFVLDRAKDMIISGGENIYPAEVENVLSSHEDIAEVAVIGAPSERWGEEPFAVVVPRADRRPEPDAIIAWARARLAPFKIPKRYAFVEALPRNAGQKVLRRELRERFAGAVLTASGDPAAPKGSLSPSEASFSSSPSRDTGSGRTSA